MKNRFCWLIVFFFLIPIDKSIATITAELNTYRASSEYNFKSSTNIKFKLLNLGQQYILFFNTKAKLNLNPLQSSRITVSREESPNLALRFAITPGNKLYPHVEQIDSTNIKITFSEKATPREAFSDLQDIKNMIDGDPQLSLIKLNDQIKLRIQSGIRNDLCSFVRGEYIYICIETDKKLQIKFPPKQYISDYMNIHKNGLQIIILKTKLFHCNELTKNGWIISFCYKPEIATQKAEQQHSPTKSVEIQDLLLTTENIINNKTISISEKQISYKLKESAFFFEFTDPILKDRLVIIPLFYAFKNTRYIDNKHFSTLPTNQGLVFALKDPLIKPSFLDTEFFLKNSENFSLSKNHNSARPLIKLKNIGPTEHTEDWCSEYNKLLQNYSATNQSVSSIIKLSDFLLTNLMTSESQANAYSILHKFTNFKHKSMMYIIMGLNSFINSNYGEAIYFFEQSPLYQEEPFLTLTKLAYIFNNKNITNISIRDIDKFINDLARFSTKIQQGILIRILTSKLTLDVSTLSGIIRKLSELPLVGDEQAIYTLARANLLFAQNLYGEALTLLSDFETNNHLLELDASLLKIKCQLKLNLQTNKNIIKKLKSLTLFNKHNLSEIHDILYRLYIKERKFWLAAKIIINYSSKHSELKNLISTNFDYFLALPLKQLVDFCISFQEVISHSQYKNISLEFLRRQYIDFGAKVFQKIILKSKSIKDLNEYINVYGAFYESKLLKFINANKSVLNLSENHIKICTAKLYFLNNKYNEIIQLLKDSNMLKNKEILQMTAYSYSMLNDSETAEILYQKMFETFSKQITQEDFLDLISLLIINKKTNLAYDTYIKFKDSIKLNQYYDNQIRYMIYCSKTVNNL